MPETDPWERSSEPAEPSPHAPCNHLIYFVNYYFTEPRELCFCTTIPVETRAPASKTFASLKGYVNVRIYLVFVLWIT